jgi:hypothetical protein
MWMDPRAGLDTCQESNSESLPVNQRFLNTRTSFTMKLSVASVLGGVINSSAPTGNMANYSTIWIQQYSIVGYTFSSCPCEKQLNILNWSLRHGTGSAASRLDLRVPLSCCKAPIVFSLILIRNMVGPRYIDLETGACRQMPGYYLKSDLDRVLPHPYQFMIRYSSYHSMQKNPELLK